MWNNWYAMQILAKERHQEMMEEARMVRLRKEIAQSEPRKKSAEKTRTTSFQLIKAGQPVH